MSVTWEFFVPVRSASVNTASGTILDVNMDGLADLAIGAGNVMLNGMTLLDLNVYQQNIVKGFVLLAALVLDNRLHPRDEETVRQGD